MFLIGCTYRDPAIKTSVTLSKITDEEYSKIGNGRTAEQNNVGTEDTAISMVYIIFDTRGLSEQDIKIIYKIQ